MNLQFLKTIKTVYTPFKTEILKLSFLEVIIGVMAFITPYIMKLIIDSYTSGPTYPWEHVLWLLGIAVILELIRNVFRTIRGIYNNATLLRFEKHLTDQSLAQYLELPVQTFAQMNSGISYNQVTNGIRSALELFWVLGNAVATNITQILVSLIILMTINVNLGLIAIVLITLMLFTLPPLETYAQPYLDAYNKDEDTFYQNMMESMINIRTVQTMAIEQTQKVSADKAFETYAASFHAYWIKLMPKVYFIVDISFDVLKYATFIYGIYLVHTQQITIGDLVLISTVAGYIMRGMHSMGEQFPRMIKFVRRVDKLLAVLNLPKKRTGGESIHHHPQTITFDGVTFNYEDKPSVLKDVSFTINPGERVALVGPSGAGKSTIIKLLYGHYEPKQGNIKIGDLDISEVKLQSLRTYLSLVPQDVELFDNTIKNNIGIGLGGVKEKDLVQASTQAAFHDFVQTLDEGYETMIGERGLKLSGGQRQRLAIARALIRKPKLLVLDEATSSLDSESEFYIQEALKNIDHSQTMLIIAHRLSTIKHCDKIIVVDQGKVVEQGSHDELLANEGLYAKLIALQDKGKL